MQKQSICRRLLTDMATVDPKQTPPTRRKIKHMKFVFVETAIEYSFQMTDA